MNCKIMILFTGYVLFWTANIGLGKGPIAPPRQRDFCPGQKPGFLNDTCDDEKPCYNDYSIECKDGTCQCRKGFMPSSENNGLCERAPGLNEQCDSICQEPYVCQPNPDPYPPYPYPGRYSGPYSGGGSGGGPRPAPRSPRSPGGGYSSAEPSSLPPHANVTSPSYDSSQATTSQGNATSQGNPTSQAYRGSSIVAPGGGSHDSVYPPYHPPPYPRPRPSKTCQCRQPYIYKDGSYCYLDCKDHEYYDKEDGKCKPKCKRDEVKLDDGSCARAAKVGEPCNDDIQCTQEFSVCKDGFCSCEPGFNAKDGSCEPEKYSCPWQEPLRDYDGQVVKCNKSTSYQSREKDTCPEGAYCLAAPSSYYPDYKKQGFCCPDPNISCPVGEPVENAACSYPAPRGSKAVKQCPFDTHYCYNVRVDNNVYESQLCCPKACGEDFISYEGACYQVVEYGDECVIDQQCQRFNGLCGSNGTCECPPDARVNEDSINKRCDINCGPDEIQSNNKCYKRLKLNESCQDDDDVNRCPINAGCDENNKCTCHCDYIPIGDSRCEPYPVCRKRDYPRPYPPYRPSPIDGPFGGSGVSGDGAVEQDEPSSSGPQNDTTESPPSGEGPPKSYGDFTFCKVGDSEPPVPAVEECPEGQYCSDYVHDLGLCCPDPNEDDDDDDDGPVHPL